MPVLRARMSECNAKGTTMPRRTGAAIAVITLLVAAQQPLRAQESSTSPGLSIQLTPYIWLPSIDTTANYPVPGGGTATTTVSTGAGELISKLNFAAMAAGEVRYRSILPPDRHHVSECKLIIEPHQVVRFGFDQRPCG